MSTQTAPEITAAPPLSFDAARDFIAARLALLGHAPDFLDGQAVAALIDYGAGSLPRLRAGLASTLFIASTEDAPFVGRALVDRALQDSDVRPTPRIRPARSHLAWPAAGAVATGLAIVTIALLLSSRPPPAPLPAHTAAPAPRPAAAAAPTPPPLAHPAAPKPASANLPARLLPQAVPRPAPTPPPLAEQRVAAPVVPPDTLPASPQTTAILMYSARDPAALGRLDALVRRLRQAGIDRIETRMVAASGPARRPVSYFFADDYEPAQTISSVIVGEGWPRLPRNSLAPRLVLTPTGVAPRRPGLIEIRLP